MAATLANIIKNINPPRQMTWAEYNALPYQVKNDGTQYYITDRDDAVQTAATTPALDQQGNSSNAQAELNKLNTSLNNLLTGQQKVYTATHIISPHEIGIRTNDWGNLGYNNTYDSNYFSISGFNGAHVFRAYPVLGIMSAGANRTFAFGKTSSTKGDGIICPGSVTNNSKTLTCSYPIFSSRSTFTITKIGITVRRINGDYPYMIYGENASQSIQLTANTVIWENSQQKYKNSISSIAATVYHGYIDFAITFINSLKTTAGGGTAILNYSPANITLYPTMIFS